MSEHELLKALTIANGMLNHVGCITNGCIGGAIQTSEDDFEQCQWCDEKLFIEKTIADAEQHLKEEAEHYDSADEPCPDCGLLLNENG